MGPSESMKKTPLSTLRGLARDCILNNPYIPVIVSLLFVMIQLLLSFCTGFFVFSDQLWSEIVMRLISLLLNVIMGLFVAGRAKYYLLLCEDKEAPVSTLFYGFRKNPDRILIAALVIESIKTLGTLPGYIYSIYHPLNLVVTKDNIVEGAVTVGVVAAGYLLVYLILVPFLPLYYLLGDFANLPVTKAIRMSFWLMKENFWRYVGLCISLIPMYLLIILSLGVGYLWISPYIQSNFAFFYLDLMKQKQKQ